MSGSRGSWRLASRLARREVRRRPLRAVLVLLLIAAPVFAITVTDVLVVTQQTRSPGEGFRREYGTADLVYQSAGAADARFEPPLPSGSRVTQVLGAELPLTPDNGKGLRVVQVKAFVTGGGLDAAGLQSTAGRSPRRGEVALSRTVAHWLGAGIGSRISLSRPRYSAVVSGIVRSENDFDTPILLASDFPFSVVLPGAIQTNAVVMLPKGYSARPALGIDEVVTSMNPAFANAAGRAASKPKTDMLHTPTGDVPLPKLISDSPPAAGGPARIVAPEQFGRAKGVGALAKFWSWVGVVLILAMVSVLIAAAFATTARRQLVTLGQLSANGSDQQFLRRMLTLQGTILGVVGAALGVGLALGALTVWHGWIEGLYHHEVTYKLTWDLAGIGATATIAATVAARFPARATSRVPVLAALAGRRPLPPVPKLQWVKAVIVFATGVGLLALVAVNAKGKGASANVAAAVAIVGGLFVIAGVAYLTPVVVTLLASLVGRLGAAARIGARGLVRVRSRSAAIVTAVAIAGTIAITIVTALLGFGLNREFGNITVPFGIAANQILITDANARFGVPPGPGQASAAPVDFAAKEAEVAQVVPGVKFRPVQGFMAAPVVDQSGSALDVQNRIDAFPAALLVAIDSPTVQEIMHLMPHGVAVLHRAGSVVNGTRFLGRGRPSPDMQLRVKSGSAFDAPTVRGSLGSIDAVMTAARAQELGIPTSVVATLGTVTERLTSDQRNVLMGGGIGDPYLPGTGTTPTLGGLGLESVQVQVGYDASSVAVWRGFWTPENLQRWFAIGALVFVLVVVAIGLLLGSSEARDETDVLEQLGVRPRTGRRMELTKAALLAFGGGVLAVPAGFIPLAVVFNAVQKPNAGFSSSADPSRQVSFPGIVFPWITAIGIVIVIPLVAALGAWAASAIAQRAHAFRGTLAFDSD